MTPSSTTRLAAPRLRSWQAAALVTLVLALWMASGLLRDEAAVEPNASATAADEPQPPLVEVVLAASEPRQRTVVLRGEIGALRTVELRAETSGRVLDLPVTRGERVAAGAPLARLDTGVRPALLAAAQARLTSAEAERTAAQSLSRRGLQAQLQTDQALAEASLAQAELDRLQREIADATVRAPFDALLERLPLEIGQLVERGDPVAMLVDDSAFEATANASQRIAQDLAVGQPVALELLDGRTLSGTLSWISAMADTATRSFAIEARLDASAEPLAAGVSATLTVPVQTVQAMYLSPSTLTLNGNGVLGIKALDADERARFVPIELLSTSLDGAWVTGIADGTRIITLGQGFVAEGERVRPSLVQAQPGPGPDTVAATR